MVGSLTNNPELFKKFQFWVYTSLLTLMITGVGVLINDHYGLKSLKEYSKEKNESQDYRLNKLVETVIEISKITTENSYGLQNLKENRIEDKEEVLDKLNKLERKVFRGGGVILKTDDQAYQPL